MARRDDSRRIPGSESTAGNPATGAGPDKDERAEYDYTGGETERPAPAAELDEQIDGSVRFDDLSRQLYATDASAYEVTPIGVVYPTSTADVKAVVEYCHAREMGVLPRGGGTSLAGQSVNEAVVLDFTQQMNEVRAIDTEARRVRAQPGVLLGDLDAALEPEGLKFAPDPAWGDKSALGGAIGNNSTGSHSLQYGKTDAYIEECEVVLADGTVTEFGTVSTEDLEAGAAGELDISEAERRIYSSVCSLLDERELIEQRYPELKRNVSGYNLDRLLSEAEDGSVNLARLLAGSEGTLAIVTEATVSLEPIPAEKAMALLRYDTVADAMADVAPIVEHDPAAVEVLDDVLLDLARETEEFGALVDEMVPEGTEAVLLVEFYADSTEEGREKVEDLLADRMRDGSREEQPPVLATSASEAYEEAERARFWKLRKSGLPILLSRTSDTKHASFIEDVAVPPETLPEFVADFREVLDDHGTFASFYGHAGPGCLHVRPLIDMKSESGIEQMTGISEDVTDLAVEYGGSVSGEHGDGRARTRFNRKLYGEEVWKLFRELKTAFDPDWILNPGQVCGYGADESLPEDTPGRAVAVSMTENLRFSPEYEAEISFEPTMNWDNDNGVQGMVELCHGCGGCRGPQETTGGVMCPTYRASEEESTSTRGRANALRQAISGDLSIEETDEEFMTEVMDLCIGCKGCARNCPSEVDMAKLKAELQHQQHEESGANLRDRLFANVDRISAIGSTLAPLPSLLQRVPGSGLVTEKLFGIARERELPSFCRETLVDWADDREPQIGRDEGTQKVLLFPDTYTNYSHPEVGKAAVQLLESAGVHVRVAEGVTASGRAAHSKGFLDTARERATANVETLAPKAATGWDIVVPEPSDAVMLQSDYLDLLAGDDVERVAANTYGFCEYLDRFGIDERVDFEPASTDVVYHGHCHQKASNRDHHAVNVLRRAGYAVDALDSGCCGMAGSFGYEAEHYSMSQSIADILDEQIEQSSGELLVTPGASCRSQLGDRRTVTDPFDRPGDLPPHPIEVLAGSCPDCS
ncbi:FAD-binding and (Fe-S)-binding domain-containing protein [Halovenus sp. HT40]|uniref:FAD-binding and (Fe-S)-binding domain-containing protein n=1 Tax=Halovenus sp. HT40 TaxID=3126691 RepID=UPI00300F4A45